MATAEKNSLSEILREGGVLNSVLPDYEPRNGQVAMAESVCDALEGGGSLIVEAGTGTGKTFAYLLPAILSGLKVVVSTGTLNLQEQIFFKDLPFIADKLELKFRSALMKGRTNYLCKRRWKRFSAQPLFEFAWEGKHFKRINTWAARTQTGDRAEIKGLPENYSAWQQISCPSHSCLGGKCEYFEDCFITRMRKNAQDADIVVVNHALFFSDLALRGMSPGVEVIPSYEAVIFDEAHDVREIATNHFGISVSTAMAAELARDAAKVKVPGSEVKSVERSLIGLNSLAEAFFRKLGGASQASRITPNDTARIREDAGRLIISLKTIESQFGNFKDGGDIEAERIAERAGEMASNIEFVTEQPSKEYVYFRESRRNWNAIKAAPIDIGPILKDKLYSFAGSVIYTSATLAVAGDFGHFEESVGLDDGDTVRRDVGTSFDPSKQALLFVPRDLPEPVDRRFNQMSCEVINRLVGLVGARTFLLFTSYRAMEESYAVLAGKLTGNVLKQGDAPRSELIDEFKSSPSVLFATMSFWQGVDIPGDALSMVIIDKLPFAVPSDPIVQARIELIRSKGKDAFLEFQVPRAVLLLRQGLGRLLRHRRDKGILALLDRRFHTKNYGRIFRDSLKDHRVTSDFDELVSFVKEEGI